MERKNLHFETLQIHVGQEQADRQQTPVQYLSIRQLPMYSITPLMQPHVSACKIREISTDA